MMNNIKRENNQDANQLGGPILFLGGLLLGSVAGAGAMLLMAPQSGKKTRNQLRWKDRKMRQQKAKTIKQKAEQRIQADQAEMDWADDGGRIVPANVGSQTQTGQ